SDFKAPSMAFPCGSRIPLLSVTVTRAFIARSQAKRPRQSSTLDEHRPASLRAFVFGHDAEPARHFRVGLEQPSKIAAKPIFVQFLVRLEIPQPARIGSNLIRD